MLSVGPDRAKPGLAWRHTRARVCVCVCGSGVGCVCVCVEGGFDRWGFEVGVGWWHILLCLGFAQFYGCPCCSYSPLVSRCALWACLQMHWAMPVAFAAWIRPTSTAESRCRPIAEAKRCCTARQVVVAAQESSPDWQLQFPYLLAQQPDWMCHVVVWILYLCPFLPSCAYVRSNLDHILVAQPGQFIFVSNLMK
jgi:hypothetical protein